MNELKNLYASLEKLEISGEDVVNDIRTEINNRELQILKDDLIPLLAKHLLSKLGDLKCQVDLSCQYDGNGNVNYSFCKSGSLALVQDTINIADCNLENTLCEINHSTASSSHSGNDIRIEKYSTKSIAVYGNTKGHSAYLKSHGGYFNKWLSGGPGWVFSLKHEEDIRRYFGLLTESTTQTANIEKDDIEVSTEKLISELKEMKAVKRFGINSPHKPILIIAIIKGIQAGRINDKVYLDSNLIKYFNELWDMYVPATCPYTRGIANPFIHLRSESFYTLIERIPISNYNIGWTTNMVQYHCSYATLSDEFIQIAHDPECSERVISFLINKYKLTTPGQRFPSRRTIENTDSTSKAVIPSLPKPKVPNQSGASVFKVTYPDGRLEIYESFLESFIHFVQDVGPERIKDLNIIVLGTNIITNHSGINNKYQKLYKPVGYDLYLNTSPGTQKKYEIMTYISQVLNLGIRIEWIPKPKISDTKQTVTTPTKEPQKMSGRNFRLIVDRGKKVIYNEVIWITLKEFIEYVGVHKVEQLNITQAGIPLVSRTLSKKYARQQHIIGDGLYLMTLSSTSNKISQIEQIAEALGIDIVFQDVY